MTELSRRPRTFAAFLSEIGRRPGIGLRVTSVACFLAGVYVRDGWHGLLLALALCSAVVAIGFVWWRR
jgi:hypothetical protein